MTVHRRSATVVLAAVAALVATAAVAPAAVAAPSGPVVVAAGLNNPRQLSLLPDGSVLLVAEAGSGGSACAPGPQGESCVGASGSIDAITAPFTARRVAPNRVVTGLLSAASADGSGAVGADGVSATNLNAINVVMTYAPPDVIPAGLPGDQAGKLLRVPAYRPGSIQADVTAYEVANDPDGQGVDSNPYAALRLADRTLVADAAGNSILSVSPSGVVSLFAVLPNIQTGLCAGQPNDAGTTGCDFVPTSLAEGPDGAIYVGALAGETPNAGRVVRLDRNTGAITRTFAGLSSVVGVAVGADGSVYASQLIFDPSKGKVTKISKGGATRTDVSVPFPGGVAVDRRNGAVYAAAYTIASAAGLGIPGTDSSGQVWRITFPTAPAV